MKKFLKYSVLIGSCFLSCQVAAAKCNWLIGATGGYQWQSINYYSVVDYGPNNPNSFTTANNDFNESGALIGLFAGYQVTNQNWTYGIELNFDKTFIDRDQVDRLASVPIPGLYWDQSTSYENEYSFGLSGRLGYHLTDFIMPYIRLGIELSKYQAHFQAVGSPLLNVLAGTYPTDLDKSSWLANLFGGLGIEVPLSNDEFTLRLEYQYHADSNSLITQSFGSIVTGPVQFTNELEPEKHSVRASVVWNIY